MPGLRGSWLELCRGSRLCCKLWTLGLAPSLFPYRLITHFSGQRLAVGLFCTQCFARPASIAELESVKPQNTLLVNKPYLVNAVQYSELHPNFELLPHTDRASLRVGDVAKVCIRFEGHPEHQGERFWVLIQTSNEGVYTGKVDNDLAHASLHGLKNGGQVAFDYRHIYDFERGPFKNASPA